MQTELVLLVDVLWLDHPADKSLNLRNKPDENEGVGHVEAGMEGCQYETQFGGVGHEHARLHCPLDHCDIIAHESADGIDEGTEHKQDPEDAEEVEEHVRQGSTAGLGIGREGC